MIILVSDDREWEDLPIPMCTRAEAIYMVSSVGTCLAKRHRTYMDSHRLMSEVLKEVANFFEFGVAL